MGRRQVSATRPARVSPRFDASWGRDALVSAVSPAPAGGHRLVLPQIEARLKLSPAPAGGTPLCAPRGAWKQGLARARGGHPGKATQEEIAEAVEVTQPTVVGWQEDFIKNSTAEDFINSRDFDPPIYNIWKLQNKTNKGCLIFTFSPAPATGLGRHCPRPGPAQRLARGHAQPP